MKTSIKLLVYSLVASASLLFANCKKPSDLKPAPPVVVSGDLQYPATQSFYDDGGSQTYLSNYEYDKDSLLTKFYRDSTVIHTIGQNQVDLTVNEYASSDKKLIHISTTSYVYVLAGTTNSAVNFYTTAPTQVTYTEFDKDVISGTTRSKLLGQIQFQNNAAGLPVKEISSDGGGYNFSFFYDTNNNLQEIDFVSLSGPRAGALYARMKVISLDDKHSPFSAVKGYWPGAFPLGYNEDYALALCKNNPIQITYDVYNADKNALVLQEQDDFSYVYNDKGYPTQIVEKFTYYDAVTTHYTRTYNYTYK